MKYLACGLVVLALQACGTVGGMVGGAGQDMTKAGEWIKNQ